MLLVVTALSLPVAGQEEEAQEAEEEPTCLLINSFYTNNVLLFDLETGEFIDVFAEAEELDGPNGITFGPDGYLYVSSYNNASVLRFDGETGEFIDVFIAPGSGGLEMPQSLVFGPDENLLINVGDPGVLRYEGTTGEPLGFFVSEGLIEPDHLMFGPDDTLYVGDLGEEENSIKRFDAETGEFIDVFAYGEELDGPLGFAFAPDGYLYVASAFNNKILRFDAETGEFIDVFAYGEELNNPCDIVIGPDENYLYVDNFRSHNVLRYDLETGELVDIFVPEGSGGLEGATYMVLAKCPS
jgi:DNA-binding beta-propeller fold protein YncE